MAKTDRLTVDRVRELFDYEPDTGMLVWKTKPSPNAHSSKIGRRAGYLNNGHRMVVIDGVYHMASRLAWMHHYGTKPSGALKYENGDTDDCRIVNLVPSNSLQGDFDHATNDGRRAYQRAHRKAFKHVYRNQELRRAFGIMLEDYERMHSAQGGKCAICRQPETMIRWGKETPLAVDHDHQTGLVRGLLCSACNQAIGLLKDDVQRIDAAAAYLRKHSDATTGPRVVASVPQFERRSAYAGYYQ